MLFVILQVEYIISLERVYGEGVLMRNDFLKSLFIYQIENWIINVI